MIKRLLLNEESVHCANCMLGHICMPHGMGSEDIERLAELVKERIRIPKGEFLYRIGHKANAIYSIRTGTIKTQIENHNGHSQITGFFLPGEVFGLDSMATGQHLSHAIVLLLLQRLPHGGGKEVDSAIAESSWERAIHLTNTIKADEQLAIDEDTLIHRLFWEENLIAYEPQAVSWYCNCSRERVADMLKMLGIAEVESILAEQNEIKVHCDFCGKPYTFDAIDSAKLFIAGASSQESQHTH